MKVINQVWKTNLEPVARLVLLALADNADQDGGNCWPSVQTIMRKTGCSRRTVQRSLLDLENGGHLSRKQILGRGCEYRIHPRQADAPSGPGKRRHSDATPASQRRPTRVGETPGGRHSDAQTTSNHQGTVNEPEARARGAPVVEGVELSIDDQDWSDFRAHRRKLGAGMTPRAEAGIIKKLETIQREHGHDPVAVLDQSIRKGWRDVFPLKPDNDGSSHGDGRGLFNAFRNPHAMRGLPE